MWQCCSSNENVIEKAEDSEDVLRFSTADENLHNNLRDKFNTDFRELIWNYVFIYVSKTPGLFGSTFREVELIDMSQPRDASYASKTKWNEDKYELEILKTERLGKDVRLPEKAEIQDKINLNSFDPSSYRSIPTEVRGITLRQLRAILPLIRRRCGKEQWTRPVYNNGKKTEEVEKVTLENATLYDINEYIIKPFTKYSQKSFVETLPSTKGTQRPRWFVSHFWGETFVHTMACLEQMVKDFEWNDNDEHDARGGGMTEDTPVWICAFANNQHNLKSEIAVDPADSSFARAMKIANFRITSILDVNNQVYTRLWCMYELYLTLLLSQEEDISGLLAIYTYLELKIRFGGHRFAVGLVDGGPTKNDYEYKESQEHFPKERLFNSMSATIQNAKASRDDDCKHILNAIVGRSGDDMELEPLKNHEKYETFNNAIRGAFASTKVGLKIAYDDGRKEYWNASLHSMKHSVTKSMKLEYYLHTFKAQGVADVFNNLPIGLEELIIYNDCLPERVGMDALFEWLANSSTNLKTIEIWNACVGGEVGGKECGERLARFLTRDDCKIEQLCLSNTDLVGSRNVDTWIECLEKNQSLKNVLFTGMADNVKDVGESELPNISIDVPDIVGKIFWDGTTFPDATLSKEQENALNLTASRKTGRVDEGERCIFNYR